MDINARPSLLSFLESCINVMHAYTWSFCCCLIPVCVICFLHVFHIFQSSEKVDHPWNDGNFSVNIGHGLFRVGFNILDADFFFQVKFEVSIHRDSTSLKGIFYYVLCYGDPLSEWQELMMIRPPTYANTGKLIFSISARWFLDGGRGEPFLSCKNLRNFRAFASCLCFFMRHLVLWRNY